MQNFHWIFSVYIVSYTCCKNSLHWFKEVKGKFREGYEIPSTPFKNVKGNILGVKKFTVVVQLNKGNRF